MIEVPECWGAYLASQPETGMGYQVVTVVLRDGRRFSHVAVVDGMITMVRGFQEIPFTSAEIEHLFVTHDKWDFNAET